MNQRMAIRAPLKMRFFRDGRVGSVFESSCIAYTLRFSARCLLALTKKSLFLKIPLVNLVAELMLGREKFRADQFQDRMQQGGCIRAYTDVFTACPEIGLL